MKPIIFTLFILLITVATSAQTTVLKGKIIDKDGEKLAKVSIIIKETREGTTSDNDGNFRLTTNRPIPFTLVVTSVGYQSQEVSVTGTDEINITMQSTSFIGQEVVLSPNRGPIKLINAPVSVEALGLRAIQATPSATYYDAIANLKGVDFTTSSLTFKTPSTRGFNGSGSARVNQFMDGMDNQSPGLNFFVGNFSGVTELDVASVELLPGASSALYGSGGMNGTILINSKNPFKYQGLSILAKEGIMNVDKSQRPNVTAYNDWSIRWAKAFGNKFAVKIGGQYIKAKDWLAHDSSNYTRIGDNGHVIPGNRNTDPNYDGVNVYGDETNTNLAKAVLGLFPDPTFVSRTGYNESYVVDPVSESIKLTGAVHYKITNNTEASLAAFWGKGNTVYTGSDRYALNNAIIAQYKLELKSNNWFLRGYTTQEDAGKSYASTVLMRRFNEVWKPSAQWYAEYIQSYVAGAIYGGLDPASAHKAARAVADQGRPVPGSTQFNQIFEQLRKIPISQGGGLFFDKTDLWVAEGQYSLADKFKFADVIIGASYRKFILNSQGTIFIDTAGTIPINEFGGYIQATKKLFNNILTLSASGRLDKNENFKGNFTPRFAALIKVAKDNNIRVSFQTAYRFPTTQQQYIKLEVGDKIWLLGGLPWIMDYMHVSKDGVVNVPDGSPFVYKEFKPETCNSFEVGYKGLINDKLLIDVYGYMSHYKNFIGRTPLFQPSTGNIYEIATNSESKVRTHGFGIGLSYSLGREFIATTNFYSDKITDVPADFIADYNTPPYRFNIGITNAGFGKQKRWGFGVQARWQDAFLFENDFGTGNINAFSTVDAQVNYKLVKNKVELRLGGSNLTNHYYKNGFGNPEVGGLYYLALRLDL